MKRYTVIYNLPILDADKNICGTRTSHLFIETDKLGQWIQNFEFGQQICYVLNGHCEIEIEFN